MMVALMLMWSDRSLAWNMGRFVCAFHGGVLVCLQRAQRWGI